jgi:ubiquinone biosynthesis protein
MLQKTLLNIEGLGRELDPELDLWKTAKPYLERWMSEQISWRGLLKTLKLEAPHWAATLPQIPRLVHRMLAEDRLGAMHAALEKLARENARRNDLISGLLLVLVAFIVVVAVALI